MNLQLLTEQSAAYTAFEDDQHAWVAVVGGGVTRRLLAFTLSPDRFM